MDCPAGCVSVSTIRNRCKGKFTVVAVTDVQNDNNWATDMKK